jgi:hypothetical protein
MKSGPVDYERLLLLRGLGWKNTAIATALGCSLRTVDGATKKLGEGRRPPGPRKVVPALQLFAAWARADLTRSEVARELGVSDKQLDRLAKLHKLPPRPPTLRNTRQVESAPDDFGEPEPPETLDLCPWVRKRIAELRLKERHIDEKIRQEWEPAFS